MRRSELEGFCLISLGVHYLLWWWGLPLATIDLGYYTEPALHLVRFGKIAAPGSQHWDLTYREAFFPYPPGYTLILAGWVSIFGAGAKSLLASTHCVHFVAGLLLWILLRLRFAVDRTSAALACMSAFPFFGHGRPELTGLLFGLAAWVTLPDRFYWRGVALTGALIGLALEVSPISGAGSAVALAGFVTLRPPWPGRDRAMGLAILAGTSACVFAAILAGTLWHSGVATLALEQARIHLTNRRQALQAGAAEVTFPYLVRFFLLPWLVLTLAPLTIALWRRRSGSTLIAVAGAWVAETALHWFGARGMFVTHGHFNLLSRPVVQGVGFHRVHRAVSAGCMIVYAAMHFYYYKQEFIVPWNARRRIEENLRAITIPGDAVIAVDGQLYPHFAGRDKLIHYQTHNWNNWGKYRNQTSPAALAQWRTPVGVPDEPKYLLACEATLLTTAGMPDPDRFEPATPGSEVLSKREFLGLPLNLSREPLRIHVFVRRRQ